MNLVFILASDNNFFNYGMRLISDINKTFRCIDFTEIDDIVRADFDTNEIYLICDIKNYYAYSLLLFGKSIKCIETNNIRIHHNSIYIHKKKASVSEAINSLNNIEMEILYLFYFHGKSVREISKMTNLSKEKIYYRVSRIKVKLGMKTTRKLPALLRIFFNQTIEPED